MSNTIKYLLVFAAGAAAGSFISWKLTKAKCEQTVQEQIDSVKEVYSKRYSGPQQSEQDDEQTEDKINIDDYITRVEESGYDTVSADDDIQNIKTYPFVITPEEFGTKDGYPCITLGYYMDKVLTDDEDKILPNVDEVVGLESLNHFGEYEDDVVYVRNDKFRCDYEIIVKYEKYSDLLKRKPYLAED